MTTHALCGIHEMAIELWEDNRIVQDHDYGVVIRGSVRILVYAVLTALLFGVIYIDALNIRDKYVFHESSPVEMVQAALLLMMSLTLLHASLKMRSLQVSAFLFFGFTTASFIRENDSVLDRLHSEAWEVLVALVVAVTLYATWRRRRRFLAELEIYTQSMSFGLFLGGLMTTYVFSRLYGMSAFWQLVMQEQYDRTIKSMSEECIELLGYGLLSFAVAEFVILARRLEWPGPQALPPTAAARDALSASGDST